MKKIIVISLLLLLIFGKSSHAQFNKYSWMVASASSLWFSAGSDYTKQDGNKINKETLMSLYLRTGPGIFLLEQMALGLYVNSVYNLQKYKVSSSGDEYTYKDGTLNLAIGPFLRYYFWQMNNLLLYGEVIGAYGVYSTVVKALEKTKTAQRLIEFQLLMGINYFLAPSLALDLNLGYILQRYKQKDYSDVEFKQQFMLCLGITWFLCHNAGLTNFQRR